MKVDRCKVPKGFNEIKIQQYALFSNAISKYKRPMIYSVCCPGVDACEWAPKFAQLWRTNTDIGQFWYTPVHDKAKWSHIGVDEIIDIASGGKSSKEREGLDKVFQLAHRKSYDILLFWALDRFSREGSRKTIAYLTILDDYGVAWHSFTEQYLSSLGIFKDCIISLLSTLARQEKIRISERTKAGLERTRRVNGTRLGRPKTAPEKLQKASKLRNEGLSYAQIAERMGVSRIRAFQMVKGAGLS